LLLHETKYAGPIVFDIIFKITVEKDGLLPEKPRQIVVSVEKVTEFVHSLLDGAFDA
jgi:hypothetical protein